MSQPSGEKRFDNAQSGEQGKIEPLPALDSVQQLPQVAPWNVELAMEWAWLGGD
ncbi:MAG TPA: hypothetical protein VIR02_19910 [Anaerolineales bacterium]